MAVKRQLGQVVQVHHQLITAHGVYGWLQVLLTGAVYEYQRDLNMRGRTADATYLSRQHVDDVCRLGTHIVLNYGAPTAANRKLLAHFMSGNYARLVEHILPAVDAELGQEIPAETLEQGANPVFRLPQQGLQMAVVHELDLRPDRKSTRLNSSHVAISYAGFCLKKKNILSRGLPLKSAHCQAEAVSGS